MCTVFKIDDVFCPVLEFRDKNQIFVKVEDLKWTFSFLLLQRLRPCLVQPKIIFFSRFLVTSNLRIQALNIDENKN